MKHLQALTEVKPFNGRSLCGLEDEELTTNPLLAECSACRNVYDDIQDTYHKEDKLKIDIGISL